MIIYKTGDILTEDVTALVNTVNTVGVMGRGVALQFKKAYPENFKAYAAACKDKMVQPGRMFVFETRRFNNPKYIINFPTKRHWRNSSRLDDIEAGLIDLVDVIERYNIDSIAIPPLGSGLGGLNWSDVKAKLEIALRPLHNINIVVFEPHGAPEPTKMVKAAEPPTMTTGRAALIGLMNRYLEGLLDPFVTLLEVHKLMYFLQTFGEPLQLKYEKGVYGPYAKNLRHVLHRIEGHFITGYADGGDTPSKRLELRPDAIKQAIAFLKHSPETQTRFEKVSNLIIGFESPFCLELLSTVHWVVAHEHATQIENIVDLTYAWNRRKEKFSRRQIGIAFDTLRSNNLIDL